jgi:hypothetical protein
MEKQALRLAIMVAGLVPVFGGGAGVILGQAAFGPWAGAGQDSHVRYLSGLLLAIGLVFWGCVPTIERRGETVRLLTLLVVVGGLARLGGVWVHGDPGRMHWALVMELVVTPVLCLWQARIEGLSRSGRRHALTPFSVG